MGKLNCRFVNVTILLCLTLIQLCGALKRKKIVEKVRCDDNGECWCPEDPLTERYGDHEDPTCTRYFLCHLSRAYRKRCDVRMAFHPEKLECMPRQQIPEKYCTFQVKCPIWSNRFVEDPEDCTKYYLCFYQRPSHWGCPEHSYFDPDTQKCIKDEHQADACVEQAKLDWAKRIKFSPDAPNTSGTLKRAKENAKQLVKNKSKT